MSKRDISGLTVVITGAARGIGEATAELLAAQGATVALGDLDTALVQQVAERIGRGAVGAHLDVTSRGARGGPSWRRWARSGRSTYSSTTPGSCRWVRCSRSPTRSPGRSSTSTCTASSTAPRRSHPAWSSVAAGTSSTWPPPSDGSRSPTERPTPRRSSPPSASARPPGPSSSRTASTSRVVLPTIVQTELAAGVPTARGVKAVTAQDVAEVIATAIRTGRPELWVPRWVQGMTKATGRAAALAAGADRRCVRGRPGARRP